MPQPFNNAVITNSGARLLTRAQAGELKIEFTRIAVGNGDYTEDEKTLSALQIQTDLKASKNSYPISDLKVYSDYSVQVTALITNLDPVTGNTLVNAGYFINEMGLFAKEKDGEPDTEVLYSIAITAGANGDFMPPYNGYNPAQITQEYFATVNNSSEVYIQTAGAAALAEDVMSIRHDVERLKQNGAADQYSEDVQYHAGEYCIYESILYKCLQDIKGEWNPECWQKTSPMEEIESLRRSLNALDTLMGGATQSKAGTAGLVPAPAAGAQGKYLKGDGTWGTPPDTVYKHPTTAGNNHIPEGGAAGKFLRWLRDGVAEWASLGAAAMYNVSNNDTTTEEGFLADARRIKALRDDVDALNSALGANIPDGAYVNVLKHSTISFTNAAVGITNCGTIAETLDKMHSSISTYSNSISQVNIAGAYQIVLSKVNDKNYCGIILTPRMSYMLLNTAEKYGLPTYFAYFNNGTDGKFSLLVPQKVG